MDERKAYQSVCGNIAAMNYLNKMGFMESVACNITCIEIWDWRIWEMMHGLHSPLNHAKSILWQTH